MMHQDIVEEIMAEFAARTGLRREDSSPVRRYLWTDAFAVCNYLTLYEQGGREEYLHLALDLVDQVHETLGRYRDDDPRSGWISGLAAGEARLHPTAGGLRIGKKQPERPKEESYAEKLEWERDGQYYHYLTKWMHALYCVSGAVADPVYSVWAAELAARAHSAFCYVAADDTLRLYWKMSIDLSRPQVATMGHHDPLDGLITCMEVRQRHESYPETGAPSLDNAIGDLAVMCRKANWTTPDPLGLGGLLVDAWRLVQLQSAAAQVVLPGLLQDMLDAAVVGLSIYTRDNSMHLPAGYRLAFRELGLSIGLQAIDRLEALVAYRADVFRNESRLEPLLEALKQYRELRERIEYFWLEPGNRKVSTWTEHSDINMVMLATSLAPEGFLDLKAE